MRRRSQLVALASISVSLLWATSVVAQSEEPSADPVATPGATATIEVVGVEYAFAELPELVEAGTAVAFVNSGAEFHELAVGRILDDETTLEELVALAGAAFTDGSVEMLPEGPLVANPGETAEGTLSLLVPGRYLATCLVPQGMVPDILAELGVTPDMAPADWPPEALAILENPNHADLGMVQIFEVSP